MTQEAQYRYTPSAPSYENAGYSILLPYTRYGQNWRIITSFAGNAGNIDEKQIENWRFE